MQRQAARQHISLVIFAAMLAGCAGTPAAFPIRTDARARSLLTGEWTGSYSGGEGGRSGSITFTLQAGDSSFTQADGEHAHGDVLMIPNGQGEPVRAADDAAGRDPGNQAPELLTINFVRARGTRVTGNLKPYRDPTCNCTLSTTFEGEITGDVIKGTFTSVPREGPPVTGQWDMQRKKP